MKIHELKIKEDYADAVYNGNKTFEIRANDRGYQKGDEIRFLVIARDSSIDFLLEHPLHKKQYKITYVHSGLGMKDEFVALAIKPVAEQLINYDIPSYTMQELDEMERICK